MKGGESGAWGTRNLGLGHPELGTKGERNSALGEG